MSEIAVNARARLAKSLDDSMLDMDDGYATIRDTRTKLLGMVMESITPESLTNPESNGVQRAALMLRGLSDAEKALAAEVNAKLRLKEQESNSQAAELLVNAIKSGSAPGVITADMLPGNIDAEMEAEFQSGVTEGEMRADNRDYSDVLEEVSK